MLKIEMKSASEGSNVSESRKGNIMLAGTRYALSLMHAKSDFVSHKYFNKISNNKVRYLPSLRSQCKHILKESYSKLEIASRLAIIDDIIKDEKKEYKKIANQLVNLRKFVKDCIEKSPKNIEKESIRNTIYNAYCDIILYERVTRFIDIKQIDHSIADFLALNILEQPSEGKILIDIIKKVSICDDYYFKEIIKDLADIFNISKENYEDFFELCRRVNNIWRQPCELTSYNNHFNRYGYAIYFNNGSLGFENPVSVHMKKLNLNVNIYHSSASHEKISTLINAFALGIKYAKKMIISDNDVFSVFLSPRNINIYVFNNKRDFEILTKCPGADSFFEGHGIYVKKSKDIDVINTHLEAGLEGIAHESVHALVHHKYVCKSAMLKKSFDICNKIMDISMCCDFIEEGLANYVARFVATSKKVDNKDPLHDICCLKLMIEGAILILKQEHSVQRCIQAYHIYKNPENAQSIYSSIGICLLCFLIYKEKYSLSKMLSYAFNDDKKYNKTMEDIREYIDNSFNKFKKWVYKHKSSDRIHDICHKLWNFFDQNKVNIKKYMQKRNEEIDCSYEKLIIDTFCNIYDKHKWFRAISYDYVLFRLEKEISECIYAVSSTISFDRVLNTKKNLQEIINYMQETSNYPYRIGQIFVIYMMEKHPDLIKEYFCILSTGNVKNINSIENKIIKYLNENFTKWLLQKKLWIDDKVDNTILSSKCAADKT